MFIQYSQEFKIFIKKIMYFLFPVILAFAILYFFAYHSGELTPIEKVVNNQLKNERKYLFGRGIVSSESQKYKFLMSAERNPEILMLGSSRILQVRREMFNKKYSFYNGGSLIEDAKDLTEFLYLFPEKSQLDIIILGVDVWWFDEKRIQDVSLIDALSRPGETSNWKAHLYVNRYLFKQLFQNPVFFVGIIKGKDPFSNDYSLGFDALMNGKGFRGDGSRQYANHIRAMREKLEYVDRESPPIKDRIKDKQQPFFSESSFSEEKLDYLKKFLDVCRKRDIMVIGIAPPFSQEVYEELNKSYYQDLLKQFNKRIPSAFADRGFMYFNYHDLSVVDLNNLYMLDGFHPSETAMAKILLDIFDSNKINNTNINNDILADSLKDNLNNPLTTSFEIYFY